MKEQGFATNYPDMARKRCGNRECSNWMIKGVASGLPVGLFFAILTDPEIGLAAGLTVAGAHFLKGLCCIEDSRRPRM